MLAQRTDAVKDTVDMLLRYEQKSAAILRYLLGRSYTIQVSWCICSVAPKAPFTCYHEDKVQSAG
jgi:hypothetical protein